MNKYLFCYQCLTPEGPHTLDSYVTMLWLTEQTIDAAREKFRDNFELKNGLRTTGLVITNIIQIIP